jgi:hypothetical protein
LDRAPPDPHLERSDPMIAYDYPLLGVFWTMLIFFLWFAWLMLLFRIFGDIFRDHELNGWGKALWSIFVIVVPLLGTLLYLIVRGDGMTRRDVQQAQEAEAAFKDYVRSTAGTGGGTAEELSKLADLHAKGVLTDEEFAAQKAKLLV